MVMGQHRLCGEGEEEETGVGEGEGEEGVQWEKEREEMPWAPRTEQMGCVTSLTMP